jgi:fumarate reductase flavoprotein subunit
VTDRPISRRELVAGIAASGVIGWGASRAWAQFGPDPALVAQAATSGRYTVNPKQVFDLIVVGAGTAGMPLAFQAAQRGTVLVIDRASMLGGTLHISGGMMSAGGTRLQKRKGIVDSPQQLYDDSMKMGHGKPNPEILRLYADNAAQTIDWLEDIGLVYPPEQPGLGVHAEFQTRRYHGGAKNGRSLLEVFLPRFQQAEAAGRIRVVLNASAAELTKNRRGAVTGVIALDASGRRTQYRGRQVVLTSGGTIRNADVFKRYHEGKGLFVERGYEHSQGQGIVIGEAAGGHVSGGGNFIAHPGAIVRDRTFPSPSIGRAALDPRRRKPWEILVNLQGERFVQEDTPSIDHYERMLTDQPNMAGFAIWDQQIYDSATSLLDGSKAEQAARFDSHMMYARADTLEAAARKLGLPAERVAATVADFNRGQASGSDRFGRRHMPLPVVKPPFYIVETYANGVFTFAGLDVNTKLQVVTAEKKPIPNLYAAGEVIGGWQCAGDVVINGCMVTPAITFGRMLGERLLTV